MFQFIRRVSGSLFPRPDRPWRDDATSHAPTIGRKRRYSVTEHDEHDSSSLAKKAKSDPVPVEPHTECVGLGSTPINAQDVKEVTKGVKEVDLEDKAEAEDAISIPPEGVPLPDSPSPSESPEAANSDVGNEEEHAVEEDSVASSAPVGDADDEAEPEVTETDDTVNETPVPSAEALDTPAECLEVEA